MTLSKHRLSKWHWYLIFYTMVTFSLQTLFSADFLNVTCSVFAEQRGLPYASILALSTPAGFVAIIGEFLIGHLCGKKGAKITMILSFALMICGICIYMLSTDLVTYAIGICIQMCGAHCLAYIGGSSLIAAWFPKKKGFAMGWITVGCNVSSALLVPLLTVFVTRFGISGGLGIMAAASFVWMVLGVFTLHDYPQDVGQTPDSATQEELAAIYAEDEYADKNAESRMTTAQLWRCPAVYACVFVIGLNFMAGYGVMSQMVVRNMSLGFTQAQALALMSFSSLFGFIGSVAWGIIEDRFGVKKAELLLLVTFIASIAFNLIGAPWAVIVSIVLIGQSIGGITTFACSLPVNIFGRHNYNKAYAIIFPLQCILQNLNYAVNALSLKLTDSYNASYSFFLIMLVVSMIILWRTDVSRYNPDYHKEMAYAKKFHKSH